VKGGGRRREAQAAPVPPAARKKLKVAEVSTEQKNTLVTKDQPKKAREETVTGNSKNKNVNTPTNLLTPQAHATQPSTVPTTREEFVAALNNQGADNGMLQTKKEQVTGFQRIVRTYLFQRIKFITRGSDLDYHGVVATKIMAKMQIPEEGHEQYWNNNRHSVCASFNGKRGTVNGQMKTEFLCELLVFVHLECEMTFLTR